jgi:3-oxoacyl-[acyl-carrier protein] reductase
MPEATVRLGWRPFGGKNSPDDYAMNLQLENKRALVTGSSSGIGEAIAKALAAEGAAVVVHGRDETKARRVADEIARSGSRAAVAIGDLASDVEAQRVVDAALAAFGSIDILVNNAGVFHVRGWWDTAPAQWIEIYNQNVGGSVRLIQALAPPMRDRRWGRIIQISSGMGLLPSPQMADYASTKIVNILTTVSLSLELANSGVTVNTVSPGPIRTPGSDDFFDAMARRRGADEKDQMIEGMFSQLTVRRFGQPEEIADAVAFLASPRASYINGVNLRVDGGFVKAF